MEKLLIGTVGVVLGAILTLFRDFWTDYRTRERKATYLAIRVTCILERFIDGCVSVALDEGEEDERGLLHTTASRPELNLEALDVDWQSLNLDLMYEILNFPSDIEESNKIVDSVAEHVAFPPYYEEIFEERQYQFSKLGLKAHDLATRLRAKYSIPKRKFENWNPIERIAETKKKIESLRHKREEKHKKKYKDA